MTRLRSNSRRLSVRTLKKNLRPLMILTLFVIVVSVLVCRAFFGYAVRAHGDTMEPSISSGTWLWVAFEPLELEHVVLVDGEDRRVLRRVVGLPGDQISMYGGRLYRNGVPIDGGKPVGKAAPAKEDSDRSALSKDLVRVPENSVFLHCDRIWLCRDAEYTGLVDTQLIVGPISELSAF